LEDLGALIACRLAMDHPELVDGLSLQARQGTRKRKFLSTPLIEVRHTLVHPMDVQVGNTEKIHRKKSWKNASLLENIRVP
jgi:hypothetical protein